MALLQWRNGVQRLLLASKRPVRKQVCTMESCPLGNKSQSTRREVACNKTGRVNGEERLARAVANVKVRRRVVIEVHGDDNSEEAADLRHRLRRSSLSGTPSLPLLVP